MKTVGKSLALLAAVVAIAPAGCGDSDSGDTTAAATGEGKGSLTKAELIERGDAICAEANAAIGTLGVEAAEAEVPDSVERSTILFIGMIERLRDLGGPTDDDGGYLRFKEAADEFADVEARLRLATEQRDPGALEKAATEAASALGEFRAQAEIYGFEECSKDAVAG